MDKTRPTLYYLDDDVSWFPEPSSALTEPNGLLAVGGDLCPERVYHGYQQGVFPWYGENEPLMWWSPDPRAVFPNCEIKLNKSLRKFLNKCDYSVSINTAFDQVIRACAKPRPNSEGTWIMPEMIQAYCQLHHQGKAHSVEVWQINGDGKTLVGGLYGVLVGNCFCGESMFSASANASKLALLCLGNIMQQSEHGMIDCQLPNPYLMSMGAQLQSRAVYLTRLAQARDKNLAKELFSPKFIDWRSTILVA